MTDKKLSVLRTIKIHKLFFIIPAGVLLFGIFFAGGVWYYVSSYGGRVYPGVKVGGYDIGGLTRREVKNFVENINNRYAKEGIDIAIDKLDNKIVKLNTVASGDSAVEIIKIDSDAVADAAVRIARSGDRVKDYILPLLVYIKTENIKPTLVISSAVLKSELTAVLSPYEDKVRDATVKNVTVDGSADVVTEKSGVTFDYDEVIEKIKNNLYHLSFQPVIAKRNNFLPSVTKGMVEDILPNLAAILKFGPIAINEVSENTTTRQWVITERELPRLVGVRATEEGRALFSLNKNEVVKYLKNVVAPEVEIPAKNARFTIDNNRVVEFDNSVVGKAIDMDETYRALNELFEVRNSLILHNTSTDAATLVVRDVLPDIQISNSNDLGIREFLGSGTSTFKDSHTRRIQNIAHAVEKLNGTLIKPGEEFSATKYAGPFTLENGYLPEAVIKGRTIKDEVGGGMCQIGTTLFRMAMQTGLPITERHNHSLAVSYYADPINGNPGTDATLYEPILDLKFLNETGSHILLLTEIDYKKQLLTFSLWGTSDGRSGWYTHPKVSKWIPPPVETEYIISATDADGRPVKGEKCQASFRGAVASFTYTRVTPEGEKIERVFDSYYRPLPRICTVPPSSTPGTVTSTAVYY